MPCPRVRAILCGTSPEPDLELFLDRGSLPHLLLAAALGASGLVCAFIGLRDGFLRGEVRSNAGVFTGRRARAVGALYLATGLAGLAGALHFVLR